MSPAVKTKCCSRKDDSKCCSVDGIAKELLVATGKLTTLANLEIREKCHWQDSGKNIEREVAGITTLVEVLEREYKKLSQGYQSCLKCSELQTLRERLISKVGINCDIELSDIIVDESGVAAWAFNNPTCVNYEDWNKWNKVLVRNLNIELTSEVEVNQLVFELSREIIKPEVILGLQLDLKKPELLELELKQIKEESKLELGLLLEIENFDLDLKTYIEIKNNKITFDTVKTVYKNDLKLQLSETRTSDRLELVTSLGNIYPVNKLNLDLNYLKSLKNK